MLAGKASLGIRVDALGEDVNAELGIEHKATLEARLKSLEEGFVSLSLSNSKIFSIYCTVVHDESN